MSGMQGWVEDFATLDARQFVIALRKLANGLSYGIDKSPFVGSGIGPGPAGADPGLADSRPGLAAIAGAERRGSTSTPRFSSTFTFLWWAVCQRRTGSAPATRANSRSKRGGIGCPKIAWRTAASLTSGTMYSWNATPSRSDAASSSTRASGSPHKI